MRCLVICMASMLLLTACGQENDGYSRTEYPTEETNSDRDWTKGCVKIIPESVSCGYPVYLADGTRYDNEEALKEAGY